jgi:hypothetical protein
MFELKMEYCERMQYYANIAEKLRKIGIKPKENILEKKRCNIEISLSEWESWAEQLILSDKGDEINQIFKYSGGCMKTKTMVNVLKQLCRLELYYENR